LVIPNICKKKKSRIRTMGGTKKKENQEVGRERGKGPGRSQGGKDVNLLGPEAHKNQRKT